uniref:ubiquitinyl hydrolase 1 n=1 Tax=Romanomermis culicivorax TaxID=13658 RepID=A0A915HI38_ROMCU
MCIKNASNVHQKDNGWKEISSFYERSILQTLVFLFQGQNTSQLEKEIGADQLPINEHFFGLVNFGNTCYCNSVIQALYFCRPFREKVLNYKHQLKKSGSTKENLLTCLADLFHNIATQKKRVGTIAPKKFVGRLKKENELFDNYMQQDAHEFLNYLLNTIGDILLEEKRKSPMPAKPSSSSSTASVKNNAVTPQQQPLDVCRLAGGGVNFTRENSPLQENTAWVHEIFQGTLTNETRCLNCESVSWFILSKWDLG